MPAWLTIYCSRGVNDVTSDDLLAGIGEADFYTIAEGFGIDDESIVDEAMSSLSFAPLTAPDGARYEVSVAPSGSRPLVIYYWTAPDRVRTELDEARDSLSGIQSANAQRVLDHLNRVTEIAAIELGWSQLDGMGIVIAGQIAECFAGLADGLIVDQNGDWWAVEDRVPVLLIGPDSGA